MPEKRIRTMLIDDSAFMRKVIGDILVSDQSIELVGMARDGQEGSEMAISLKPDVIVTDIVMPDYDGVYLVKYIMERQPVPIILLSSLEKTDSRIFDALGNGAFDFIDKPSNVDRTSLADYKLVGLIKEASVTDVTVLKAKQLARKNVHAHSFDGKLNYEIVVVGASTGGPGALEMIINNLPKNLALPVILVQHMPHRFLQSFSARLNEHSPMPVKLAADGDLVRGGNIYVAPGEGNLRVVRNARGLAAFETTEQRYPEYNFPSIDCLFESVAEAYGRNTIGVILTGMGKDGAAGLRRIAEHGGFTIAQDEDSSVVYGMPKAAVDSGAVRQVVSLAQIPGFIISCL